MSAIYGGWICLLAPLGAAALITLAGNRISRRGAGYLGTFSTFVAFVGALVSFFTLLGENPDERTHTSTAWTWLSAGNLDFGLQILIDPLSVFMMLIVTGVGSLIVGYSIGYMDGDDEERRYFAYMAVFVFSMLLLVEGGNLPDPARRLGDGRPLLVPADRLPPPAPRRRSPPPRRRSS